MKKAIYAVNSYVLWIALALTFLMMLLTVGDVFARLFYKPIPGVFELTRYSLGVIVFTSLGFSQIHKVHIAVDLLVSRLPLLWRNIVNVLIYLVASAVFALAFWQMLAYAMRLMDSNLFTTVLRIKVYPWVLVSAIGVLCFTLVLLTDLFDSIKKLIKGGDSE